MEIRSLKYFAAVCETLNFRKAADKLHISQPSLSASIQKLEEELDVKLLYRDNKRVMITREGSVFYKEACEILEKIASVENRMQDMKQEEKRRLTLAFPSTSGAWLWPELLEDFRAANPNIELTVFDMSSYDILRGIRNDELELGYGVLDIDIPEDVKMMTVLEDEAKLLLNVSDPLAAEETIDIRKLSGKRIAMYNAGSSFCEAAFLKLLKENAVEAEILYVRQQSSVFNLVAQGLAAAVILDDIELVRNNDAICLRKMKPVLPYKCGFMWKKNRYLSASAKKLLDYFKK